MLRVTTVFSGLGVTGGGVNRLYFGGFDGTAAQAHAAVVAFWNELRPRISTAVSYTVDGTIDTINEATGQITGQSATDAVSAVGTNGGDRLPNANQGLIRLLTGAFVSGRQVRGRIFIPGAVETDSTAGVPLSTYTAALNTAIGNLIGNATSDLDVWSRTNGQASLVTAGSTWTQWAVLRSRRD